MADPKLGQWICSALGLLMLLKTEGLYVGITILESAVAKGAGKRLHSASSLIVTSFPNEESLEVFAFCINDVDEFDFFFPCSLFGW